MDSLKFCCRPELPISPVARRILLMSGQDMTNTGQTSRLARNSELLVRAIVFSIVLGYFLSFSGSELLGQNNSAQNVKIALTRMPTQKGIDVDTVAPAEFPNCKQESNEEFYSGKGFMIVGPSQNFLRLYIREGSGSHWTFFKDNEEVYREIDTDGDRRINEYRWMGSAGSRWGIDKNQDGTIDSWKAISAEDVAQEAFEAFRTKDKARFLRLMLKNDDLQQLSLGSKAQKIVVDKVNMMANGIGKTLTAERSITRDSEYLSISGLGVSAVPKGKMGLGKDLVIYDNAAAMFKNGDKFRSIQLGTLVQVGERWRLLEMPVVADGEAVNANGGLFRNPTPDITPLPPNELMAAYEKADKALKTATGRAKEAAHKQRFDIMLKIIAKSEAEEKKLWNNMLASDASMSYSSKEYSGGKKLLQLLSKSEITEGYHDMFAWELVRLEGVGSEDNMALLDGMERFVTAYPDSVHSKEAYRQLALFSEFDSSPVETSLKWYKELVGRFPESTEGQFAEGAIRRLTSLDELLDFNGETFTKQRFSLSAYRGKRMVVLHYWSTVDQLSLADFEELIALRAKYKDELSIIGINVDDKMATATAYLKSEQPNAKWPNLWAEGGREQSPLVLQLGVISVPTTILINKRGEVVENEITVSELDREIYRLKRRER